MQRRKHPCPATGEHLPWLVAAAASPMYRHGPL